jgi:hypothetical protein
VDIYAVKLASKPIYWHYYQPPIFQFSLKYTNLTISACQITMISSITGTHISALLLGEKEGLCSLVWHMINNEKDSAGSDNTASMIKGGGYVMPTPGNPPPRHLPNAYSYIF